MSNAPQFTPPAAVSATAGTNTPAIGTSNAELDAMYPNSTPPVAAAIPAPAAEKVVTDGDKAKETPTTDVGGYKDEAAAAAAGYQDPAAKPDAEPKAADANPEEAHKVEFDKTGHSEQAVKVIEGFAEVNKLSKEQTAEFATFVKSIQDAQVKAQEKAVNDQKLAFQSDFDTLKNHKDFGGENLDKSFKKVGQVLDLMPGVKKHLTDTKSRLQPQIMIAFNDLHSKLFGQEGNIVQGGTNTPTATNEPWNDFYS